MAVVNGRDELKGSFYLDVKIERTAISARVATG